MPDIGESLVEHAKGAATAFIEIDIAGELRRITPFVDEPFLKWWAADLARCPDQEKRERLVRQLIDICVDSAKEVRDLAIGVLKAAGQTEAVVMRADGPQTVRLDSLAYGADENGWK